MHSASTILLAIDTSTRMVSLALYDGVEVLCESSWTSVDYHTVELAPAVAEAFDKARLTANDLGALAVALGPGSFTGLRIGMALVKGLALAKHLPVIGVPTLDILAAAQPLAQFQLAAVSRAGRGRLAVGWYQAQNETWNMVGEFEVFTPEELASRITQPTFICGELNKAEREFLVHNKAEIHLVSPARSLRRAGFLAELAWKRWQAGQSDDPASLSPIYLHYNDPIPG